MPLLRDITVGALGDDNDKKIESLVQQTNEAFRQVSNEERTKITKDDAGDGRLLVGYQEGGFSNGNVGVKMSQEGVDVEKATDEELIFSTDFNLFKIVGSGTVTLDIAAISSVQTVTVTHNLGYVPAIISYVKTPSGSYRQMPFTYMTIASPPVLDAVIYAEVTTTTATFNMQNNAISLIGTYTFKYYLMQETAS